MSDPRDPIDDGMVTARTLTTSDFDAVHAAFTDAFSDYVVKLSPMRIMNVDERDEAFAAFLERSGAKRTVRQLEMLRAL
jgi:hypothetical protein